jgi:hypothetical protein
LLAVALAACANVLGINSDRHLTADADTVQPDAQDMSDGGAEAGPWDCLSDNGDPGSGPVDVTMITYDAVKPFAEGTADGGPNGIVLLTYAPLTGVSIRACTSLDPTCAQGTDFTTTDEAGATHISVPNNFVGFFEVTRPDLIPVTVNQTHFLANSAAQQVAASMMTSQSAALIASAIGVPLQLGPDSGTGMLFLGVSDCNDQRAAGVTFTLSNAGPKTAVFYNKDGFPSTMESQTSNGLGGGGAINVPAGDLEVGATFLPNLSLGTQHVIVRSGGIVEISFRMRKR